MENVIANIPYFNVIVSLFLVLLLMLCICIAMLMPPILVILDYKVDLLRLEWKFAKMEHDRVFPPERSLTRRVIDKIKSIFKKESGKE